MKKTAFFTRIAALGLAFASPLCLGIEKEVWEAVNHNVRIMRHRDGTNTEYRRTNDDKTLVKKRLSDVKGGRNSTITTTVYRMDSHGNPLSCKIFDGKENLLFKVSYGYHRETGQLIAEDMYDVRRPQINPKTREEMPIRRMYWFYDGAGNVTKAFSFVWRKGDYAEEHYDSSKSNYPVDNPFNQKSTAGTPAAPRKEVKEKGPDKEEFAVPPPLPPLPFER